MVCWILGDVLTVISTFCAYVFKLFLVTIDLAVGFYFYGGKIQVFIIFFFFLVKKKVVLQKSSVQ